MSLLKNKKDNGKLTFKEKLLEKSFGGLCEKLLFACFYVYKKNQSNDLTYDEFCLDVKDTLKNGVREE